MVALRKRQSSQTHSPVSPTGDGVAARAVPEESQPGLISPPASRAAASSPPQRSVDAANGSTDTAGDGRSASVGSREERLRADGHPPGAALPPLLAEQPDLRARLADLQRAEQAQREHYLQKQAELLANMVPQPQEQPKAQFGARDYAFVEARGLRLDSPEVVRAAERAMTSGAPWPSDEFYQAMEQLLPLPPQQENNGGSREKSLHGMGGDLEVEQAAPRPQTRAALATEEREAEPEHERPVVSPEEIRRAALTSAPPSREMPSMRTGRQEGRVTLSVVEREIAKGSGLTDIEYAAQKLRLQREKAADPERFSDR